jgi:hypothetical protein
MIVTLSLNYPAAIPAGHEIEVTEFADTRPEWHGRPGWTEPFRLPAILDLNTSIRYMNHAHASPGANGGNSFTPNSYPVRPRSALAVERVYRARVVACTLVMVEGLGIQHTTLVIEPLGAPSAP